MKKLYEAIIARLTSQTVQADFQAQGVSPVKLVDIYKEQYYDKQSFEMMPLPAVLVQWQRAKNAEEGKVTCQLTLHLVYEQSRGTSSIEASRDEANKVFDFIDLVNAHLINLETEESGKLRWDGDQQQVPEQALTAVYLQQYTCSMNSYDVDEEYEESDGEGSLSMTRRVKQEFTGEDYGFG